MVSEKSRFSVARSVGNRSQTRVRWERVLGRPHQSGSKDGVRPSRRRLGFSRLQWRSTPPERKCCKSDYHEPGNGSLDAAKVNSQQVGPNRLWSRPPRSTCL